METPDLTGPRICGNELRRCRAIWMPGKPPVEKVSPEVDELRTACSPAILLRSGRNGFPEKLDIRSPQTSSNRNRRLTRWTHLATGREAGQLRPSGDQAVTGSCFGIAAATSADPEQPVGEVVSRGHGVGIEAPQ